MKTLDLETELGVLDAIDADLARRLKQRRQMSDLIRQKRQAAGLPASDPKHEQYILRQWSMFLPRSGPLARAIITWCEETYVPQ